MKTKPTPWGSHFHTKLPDPDCDEIQINEHGIPNYLTSIIASSLQWIDDEGIREEIWEAASARLAERSGRTAQATLSRTFSIPQPFSSEDPIHISLREPSLTADNLGHKTWLASYLLARRLPSLKPVLPPLADVPTESYKFSTNVYHALADPIRVLELGSGTGLLGIAAASLFPAWQVRLTDLEAIVPNLQANVNANSTLFRFSNVPKVDELDWSLTPAPPTKATEGYNIILASDPLYSPSHPEWLFNTIHGYLLQHETSRVVVELPLRKAYVPEVEEFKARMGDGGFALLESGEETGTEDWSDNSRQGSREVECWWGIWGW